MKHDMYPPTIVYEDVSQIFFSSSYA